MPLSSVRPRFSKREFSFCIAHRSLKARMREGVSHGVLVCMRVRGARWSQRAIVQWSVRLTKKHIRKELFMFHDVYAFFVCGRRRVCCVCVDFVLVKTPACVRARVNECVSECVRAYAHVQSLCVNASVRARVNECVSECVRAYVHV